MVIEKVQAITDVGGREFDAKFYDYFMDILEEQEKGVKEKVKYNNRLLYTLVSFLNKTKCNLCSGIRDWTCDVSKLNLDCETVDLNYDDFEQHILDLVDRLRRLVEDTVGQQRITKFCFCGSSSRVPAILKMYKRLASRAGSRFSEVVQTDESVARGLCYYGYLHTIDNSDIPAVPVRLNKTITVDGVEWNAILNEYNMEKEADRLKREGDGEWMKVQQETDKRKSLILEYQTSVSRCSQLLEEWGRREGFTV